MLATIAQKAQRKGATNRVSTLGCFVASELFMGRASFVEELPEF